MEKRPPPRAKNLSYLRNSNAGGALKILLTQNGTTRNDLADQLGLTKMSITYIINDLLEKQVIQEHKAPSLVTGHPGKRPTVLTIQPFRLYAIGVSISRDRVQSSVVDLTGQLLDRIEDTFTAQTTRYTLLGTIVEHVSELLSRHKALLIIGIGVACVGLVDSGIGVIAETTNFYEIHDVPVKNELERKFDLPVFAVNDMKAAALAENLYGVAMRYTDYVYLGVTNGIGAGVVINGKLFEGARGFSSEIGHLVVNHQGERCSCGSYGCLELYASVPNLLKKARLDRWDAFLAALDAQDSYCVGIMDHFCQEMGAALVSICNLFDPQAIVIGHEGASIPRRYFGEMQLILDQRTMTRNIKRVVVLPSTIGDKATWMGASSIVFSHLFMGQIQI